MNQGVGAHTGIHKLAAPWHQQPAQAGVSVQHPSQYNPRGCSPASQPGERSFALGRCFYGVFISSPS